MSLSRNGQIIVSSLVLTCEPFIYSFPLQQVANAAKVNASAVLIFPDRDDYQFEESEDATELFGHVSMKTVLLRCTSEVSAVPQFMFFTQFEVVGLHGGY